MKSINSLIKWILFVPVCVLSVAIAFFNGLHEGSVADFFATNRNGVAEIIAFSVLGLFIACFVISLFDRRTSPVHMLRKNYFCGVTAIGAALAMAASAAFDVTNIINSQASVRFTSILTILFTAIGGFTMLYFGLNHFNASNSTKNISLLYLSLPLWCATHLVDRFLNNTATPVAAAESMDLIMFVAMAMFFINISMIHSVVYVKNSVKAAVNFGLPTVVISLVYSITQLFTVINAEKFEALKLIPAISYGMIALYAMGFVAELSFKSRSVDEQIIIGTEEEQDEDYVNEYYDDTEVSEETSEDEAYDDMYVETDEISDEEDFDASVETEDYYEDNDVLSEDNINFDPADDDTDENADVPFAGAVRIVDDSDDDDVALDDDIDFTDDESDSEDSVSADELFKVAQMTDNKNSENKIDTEISESEDVMILDKETTVVEPVVRKSSKNDDKPKGPTTREAIMYEEDDFILNVESNDYDDASKVKTDEEISAFILDDKEEMDEKIAKKSYEERLDEIDRLIISIQGGDDLEKK